MTLNLVRSQEIENCVITNIQTDVCNKAGCKHHEAKTTNEDDLHTLKSSSKVDPCEAPGKSTTNRHGLDPVPQVRDHHLDHTRRQLGNFEYKHCRMKHP